MKRKIALFLSGCLFATVTGAVAYRWGQHSVQCVDDETPYAIFCQRHETTATVQEFINANPKALNKWACDYVNALNISDGGCYDTCTDLSDYVITDGYLYANEKEPDRKPYKFTAPSPERFPDGLNFEKHGDALANACAIVMHGTEY